MERIESIKSWVMAARPKSLTASLIPIAVGTALVDASSIDWSISLWALCFALMIQIGTNLVNDALDFKKGTDTHERIGFKRVTQAGIFSMSQVLYTGIACFLVAAAFAIPLVYQGGMPIFILMIASILAGYCYTGGPFPLAYLGLGDLFVFIFYGFVAIMGMYFLQTGGVNSNTILAGAQIGSLATVIIALNNLRDCKQDIKTNKMTLPVRFGISAGRFEIGFLLALPFILSLCWIKEGQIYAGILPLITLPLALYLILVVYKTEPSAAYNSYFGTAALLHLSFGLLLTIGLLL